jgi:protein-S-isoprenylcysteine O-methyltransferase Ste14
MNKPFVREPDNIADCCARRGPEGEPLDREQIGVVRRAALKLGCFLAVGVFLTVWTGWWKGCLFLAVLTLLTATGGYYVWRKNPDVLVARNQSHKGTKVWDTVLMSFVRVLLPGVFVVASLDAQFHWSRAPLWLMVLGYALFVAGMTGAFWVVSVNRFAERTVRIQAERGHHVVDTGPYAVVRHPMYAALFFAYADTALALGSLWALVPSVLASLLLVLRTAVEDRTLRMELQGYREYAGRVRYRLIPGVW